MIKSNYTFEKILIEEVLKNEDYGFFAKYEQVYFYKKGVKILSTIENIDYNLKEVDYYFLENEKIAKFIRHESLIDSKRELLCEYTFADKAQKLDKLIYNNKIQLEFLKKAI